MPKVRLKTLIGVSLGWVALVSSDKTVGQQVQFAPVRQPPLAQRPWSELRDYRGVFVTNFEIGYFVECDASHGQCDQWGSQESRWLNGRTPEIEAAFQRCVAAWNGSRDRWALYAITFQGRETLDRQPRYFLHDTERRVQLEEIHALELIGTDATVDWALPRYRSQPAMRCPAN